MTAEEIDVCRNLEASAAKGMKSKRMLRVLSSLQDKGLIEYDPFAGAAALTAAGSLVLSQHHRGSENV